MSPVMRYSTIAAICVTMFGQICAHPIGNNTTITSNSSMNAPPTETAIDCTHIINILPMVHPAGSDRYYQCANGVVHLGLCPAGLLFSARSGHCVLPSDCECLAEAPVETTTTTTTSTTSTTTTTTQRPTTTTTPCPITTTTPCPSPQPTTPSPCPCWTTTPCPCNCPIRQTSY